VAGQTGRRVSGGLEFVIEEAGPELVRSRMPVAAQMLNPFGVVHAGALIWLADVTATVLALGGREAGGPGQPGFPLAIDLHTTLLGNVGRGEIVAEARPVRRGRRVTVVRTRVSAGDKLLAEVTTSHIPS
jgi:uncharacterized protein (TIGR00369 family)